MNFEELTRRALRIELDNISQTIIELSQNSTRIFDYCEMLTQSFESFDFNSFKKSLEFCTDYLFYVYGSEKKELYIINDQHTPFCDEIFTDNYQAYIFSNELNTYIDENKTLFIENFFKEITGLRSSITNLKSNRIFIIHGREKLIKTEVARTLEQLGLEPVILDEQSNKGDTLFEKLEKNMNVGYAITIYTPDDVGSLKGEELKPRARQNVIFEHGLLVGRIGRRNVFHLIVGEKEIETPSDINGLVYEKYDSTNGWKLKLIKELKACGYDIDANKLI